MGRKRKEPEPIMPTNERFLNDDEAEAIEAGDSASDTAEVKTQQNILVGVTPRNHARLSRLATLRQMGGQPGKITQVLNEVLEEALTEVEAEFAEELAVLEKMRQKLSRRS